MAARRRRTPIATCDSEQGTVRRRAPEVVRRIREAGRGLPKRTRLEGIAGLDARGPLLRPWPQQSLRNSARVIPSAARNPPPAGANAAVCRGFLAALRR